MNRRHTLFGLGGAALAGHLLIRPAQAQAAFPSQPMKIVVPYPPGGLTDVAARLIGEHLQGVLGQPVLIENKAGAGTQLGAAMVAKAPADGHTLLLATVTTLCIAPALYAKPMIAVSDFAGIALLGNVTLILVGRPDLPAAGVKELMAMLRAKPGGMSYGSPGIGTAHHLLAELVMSREQVKAVHVPYPGSVKAVADLMEGRFDFMFVDGTVALPQIAAGKLKPLAVTGPGRWPVQANIPALAESYPGLAQQPWLSIAGPTGMPAAVRGRLNGEINRALAEPIIYERLRQVGLDAAPLTLGAFEDFIRSDAGKWAEMVRISGAKAE